MSGPNDEDEALASAHTAKMNETAEVFGKYVDRNRLDPVHLRSVLDRAAPGNDAAEDGIYDQRWLSTETFYRQTEDYVDPDKRAMYKLDLERVFPGKKGVI